MYNLIEGIMLFYIKYRWLHGVITLWKKGLDRGRVKHVSFYHDEGGLGRDLDGRWLHVLFDSINLTKLA
jgi:hypothetical protein